jgi:hypothetical protein
LKTCSLKVQNLPCDINAFSNLTQNVLEATACSRMGASPPWGRLASGDTHTLSRTSIGPSDADRVRRRVGRQVQDGLARTLRARKGGQGPMEVGKPLHSRRKIREMSTSVSHGGVPEPAHGAQPERERSLKRSALTFFFLQCAHKSEAISCICKLDLTIR